MSFLKEVITGEINHRGPMTFARFMELALYHPRYGYYTSQVRIGRRGDFYTAPTVSSLFGAMLARQLEEMWRLAGSPGHWVLVEYGPGTGKLAWDIMDSIPGLNPAFYDTVTYYLVEISPGLREQQQETLARHPAADKFRWVNDPAAISATGFAGCVLANELVDAFPVHLVRQSGGGLKELYVIQEAEGFGYWEGEVSRAELPAYLAMQKVVLEEGQRAEINLQAGQWLQHMADHLRRGFVLVIDYGTTAPDLYGRHRFNGTLRCFHRHQLVEDPLVNVGGQDITAHVNFTALGLQGGGAGFTVLGPVSQPQFLLNLGILDTVKDYKDFTYNAAAQKKTAAIK